MALCDYGVTPDVLAAAIREVIREQDELPTVARLISYCHAAYLKEASASWSCPECGSERVAVLRGTVVLCFDCDWEPVSSTPGATCSS